MGKKTYKECERRSNNKEEASKINKTAGLLDQSQDWQFEMDLEFEEDKMFTYTGYMQFHGALANEDEEDHYHQVDTSTGRHAARPIKGIG